MRLPSRLREHYLCRMQNIRLYFFVSAALGVLSLAAAAAEAPSSNSAKPPPATAQCKEAAVSPVSGFAECVNPRGAPVAPAPKRPDAAPATQDR
jgi:hypothetical protein